MNPNHTRTNQRSIRIKGLNAGTPNYKFSTLITQSHCFWRVRGSTWITNKELEKLTLKHRLTPLPPHSLLFITGHFPKLRESNVWHWLSTHICNKMRWDSCRHWLVKTTRLDPLSVILSYKKFLFFKFQLWRKRPLKCHIEDNSRKYLQFQNHSIHFLPNISNNLVS